MQAECAYLWAWFVELSNARSSSQAISYRELRDWSALMQIDLDVFEVKAIKALDAVFLNRKKKA